MDNVSIKVVAKTVSFPGVELKRYNIDLRSFLAQIDFCKIKCLADSRSMGHCISSPFNRSWLGAPRNRLLEEALYKLPE